MIKFPFRRRRSSHAEEEFGEVFVRQVTKKLLIDDEWRLSIRRGVTWWPHRMRQQIWVDPAFAEEDGSIRARVHLRTDLGVCVPEERTDLLTRLFLLSPLSTLIREPDTGRLYLASALDLAPEILDGSVEMTTWAALIQAADAEWAHENLVEVEGLKPAVVSHPSSGPRPARDELLDNVALLLLLGQSSSPGWDRLAFEMAAKHLGPGIVATASDDGLTAEFPFGPRTSGLPAALAGNPHTSLLQVTLSRDPDWGPGLACRLRFGNPYRAPGQNTPERAIEMGARELADPRAGSLLGCWMPDEFGLQFLAFFPICFSRMGQLWIVLDMAQRAMRANQLLLGR
jgi:hypothetical protein